MDNTDASTGSGDHRLMFERVRVQIDITFWMELRQRKLREWKLSEPVVLLKGVPTAVATVGKSDRDCSVSVGGGGGGGTNSNDIVFSRDSFSCETSSLPDPSAATDSFVRGSVPGVLKNYNILQDVENMDTDAALFAVLQEKLLKPLVLAALPACPTEDCTEDQEAVVWRTAPFLIFAMYAFVDAKSYTFHHREAFPVMSVDSPLFVDEVSGANGRTLLPAAVEEEMQRYSLWRAREFGTASLYNPFLCTFDHEQNHTANVRFDEFSPSRYARLLEQCRCASKEAKVVICFRDMVAAAASASSSPPTLGWPMRNFLLCLRLKLPATTQLTLFAIREGGNSVCLRCSCEPLADGAAMVRELELSAVASATPPPPPVFLRLTGWRKTSVHVASINTHMNPVSLAEEGSRLNLELMKWRQLPSLNLEGLASCRALLLGTGTLGCNVARSLLMWGVRHLTLVDRGTVHYSNLARQSLFTAEDAARKGREKTTAAADALRAIIPSVNAVPVTMTIHMPGHRTDPTRADETCAEIERLDRLVKSHDVVFLLTDSREARWLPTVLATAHDTPVINVALGFDSYVVMRHGLRGSDVRCYFCSDVTAPSDSLSARALDQQCTVTRPGVSGVASSLAVELLAAMYQQDPPFGRGDGSAATSDNAAAATTAAAGTAKHSRLGLVPEQIRGSVYTYETNLLSGRRNPNCTACSRGIQETYAREGIAFLLQCINDPSCIEAVSGLSASKALWDAQNADADWSCDSSVSCDGSP